jgi:signal transduction histidine kinase
MVDHFARSHDGKVEALSRPDGGTIVRITLPLANAPESSEASDEES